MCAYARRFLRLGLVFFLAIAIFVRQNYCVKMRIITLLHSFVALLLCCHVTAQECENRGFNLIVVGDPQPQTEAQMVALERDIIPHIEVIVDQYSDAGYPTAILLTGDVVWDTMEFLPRVKSAFEALGVPVYAVIGNHDHNRAVVHNEPLAETPYEECFGERYYAFTMGDTYLFALDNISYNSYDDYSLDVDRKQLRWLRRELRRVPKDARVAILMHAPAVDYRTGKLIPYARSIVRLVGDRELHFVTGHRHRHATADISPTAIEHSVAQVNGNLWFAPLCSDGMPQSVFCIEERDDSWTWHYRVLGVSSEDILDIWTENSVSGYEDSVVVKVVGWDEKWSVEWMENGQKMGAMEQIEIYDPDYMYYVENVADYNDVIMGRLRRSAQKHNHYFRCRRTAENSLITIVATDRFGRQFTSGIKGESITPWCRYSW